jgi:SSS family solute:Na+ symporter
VAYVITKIAVGIYAGGVVSDTLLPEMSYQIGSFTLDSFWIGSVLVVLLTGLYTVLGGMRAVAYTEALQTIILIMGSVLVTYFGLQAVGGWEELRRIAQSESDPPGHVEKFDLWKPVMPEGSTWEPVLEKDESGKVVRQAWYFNDNYPWLGMLLCAPIIGLWYWCTDQYIVQRALGAPNETEARRGSIFAAFLKLLPVFIFIIPGIICFALAKTGKVAELAPLVDANGVANAAESQAAFPLLVKHVLPAGFHGRDDHHRAGVDPRDSLRAARPVRLSAERARLPGPADLRRLFPGRLLATAQRSRVFSRLDHRVHHGRLSAGCRHTRQAEDVRRRSGR